jgi:hypothetical protein
MRICSGSVRDRPKSDCWGQADVPSAREILPSLTHNGPLRLTSSAMQHLRSIVGIPPALQPSLVADLRRKPYAFGVRLISQTLGVLR